MPHKVKRDSHMHGRWRRFAVASFFLLPLLGAAAARAQSYPTHPVRLISDSAAGSAVDVSLRIIADGLTRVWGQQAAVINQPGAGGAIAAHAAAAAAPDGHMLFMPAFSAFVALPGVADNLPIVLPRDFAPVGSLGGAPMFITAADWLNVKTLPELIALAKQKPGELTYGTNGAGRLTNLTGELLQSRAGIKLLMVPYSGGTAQVLTDMMGKRIALAFDSYSGVAGAIQAGNARPLAVASDKRVALFPNLPTAAETLPGFESNGWQVLVAPIGTPDAVVQKANADLRKALADPDVQDRLAKLGRTDTPMSPEQTLAFIRAEQEKWAPILKLIGAGH
jgi:tripartite-type tricarboxylate transporter receptor subunit TctC